MSRTGSGSTEPQNVRLDPSSPAVERHPHLGAAIAPDVIRVDCHSHTMWSGDCTTTPEELVSALSECVVDVVCITDHNAVAGALALQHDLPCRVVVGEEVRVGAGEIIGLFLTERIPIGLGAVEVAERIRSQGGLVYLPHPFDPMRNCLPADQIDDLVERRLVDGIEGFNAKTSLDSLNRKAAAFGTANDLFVGAGSDAHVPEAFGAAYVEMPDFTDAADFAKQIRSGRIVGHHFDPARQWSPRIVPSTDSYG